MARGWLLSPVITETEQVGPRGREQTITTVRPEVLARQGVQGDALMAVMDASRNLALVAYEVADDTDLAPYKLAAEDDLDKAADRVAEADKLEALARDAKVGTAGTAREVLRRVARSIAPNFDERRYLTSRLAPEPGSFVNDTFTDEDGTFWFKHEGETGAKWTNFTKLGVGGESPIYSNRLAFKGSVNIIVKGRASGEPASPDYSVTAKLYGHTEAGKAGAFLRETSQNFYGAMWEAGKVKLYKLTEEGGKTEELANFTTTVEGAHTLVIEAIGEDIRVYWDGEEKLHVEDGTLTEAGKAGLWGYGEGKAEAQVHIDSVTATDAGGEEGGGEALELTIDPATETDSALPLSATKPLSLAPATESDVAAALSAQKAIELSGATEVDAATQVSVVKALSLVPGAEVDTAASLKAPIFLTLAPATETDSGQAISVAKLLALVAAVESDSVEALSIAKSLTLPIGLEDDVARKVVEAAEEGGAAAVLAFLSHRNRIVNP